MFKHRITLLLAASVVLTSASVSPVAAVNGNSVSWELVDSEIEGQTIGENLGTSVSLNDDGTIVASGAPLFGASPNTERGHVVVHRLVDNTWTPMGSAITGETGGDYFGQSVSLSADGLVLAVGAPYNDGVGLSAGQVRVYYWSGTAWVQRGTDIDGEASNDQSGTSVSLSSDGTRVSIGAPQNAGGGAQAGQVRIYEWNGTLWSKLGADIDGATGEQLGGSVSLSGDGTTVAAGARANTSNTGIARVYSWSGTAWGAKGAAIPGEAAEDFFGWSVSLDETGNTLAVGAPYNDGGGTSAGSVRVYGFASSSWSQKGSDIDGQVAGDLFGWAVTLSHDGFTLAAGAPKNDDFASNSGHVSVLEFAEGSWGPRGATISGEAAGDESGYAVSLSATGTRVAIGAPFHDVVAAADEGQVRVLSYPVPDEEVVTSSTPAADGLHGIYLHVAGPVGRSVAGSPIYYGSYKIKPNSPNLLSVREVGSLSAKAITVAKGQTNGRGSFDTRALFGAVKPGNYIITLTGVHASGTGLRLQAPFSVGSTGEFTALGSNLPGIW